MAKDFKEKTITINLARVFEKPVTKRCISAKHTICESVKKETRLKEFKISNELNMLLWSKGKYNAQRKITIKVVKDKDTARIMLPTEKYEPKEAKKTAAPKAEAALPKEEKAEVKTEAKAEKPKKEAKKE